VALVQPRPGPRRDTSARVGAVDDRIGGEVEVPGGEEGPWDQGCRLGAT
jgi:hypothetical protein